MRTQNYDTTGRGGPLGFMPACIITLLLGLLAVTVAPAGSAAAQAPSPVAGCEAAAEIIAGSGTGSEGYSGDGQAAVDAILAGPHGVAAADTGDIYIADTFNTVVRRVDPSGTITTFAGTGVAGFSGDTGPAAAAELNWPLGIDVDATGAVYVADWSNHAIRRVDTGGIIETVAGSGAQGYSADGAGAATLMLNQPGAVVASGADSFYFTDGTNAIVRSVDAVGHMTTVAGTPQTSGYSGDNGAAVNATLSYSARALETDAAGNLYIADTTNHVVRRVDPTGIITTIAGTGTQGSVTDGTGLGTSFDYPGGLAADNMGGLYISDSNNQRVMHLDLATGSITRLSMPVTLSLPAGLDIAGDGSLLIANSGANNVVSWNCFPPVSCAASSDGLVAWWPFEESHPQGIEADAYSAFPVGATNGTVTADPLGVAGTAASFMAPGDISVASGVDFGLTDQYSVDLYFKTTASSGTLLDFRDSRWGPVANPNSDGFLIHLLNSGRLLWQTPRATGSYGWHGVGETLPQPINDGEWHRVTITRDGQQNNLYVDGNLAFSTTGGDGANNNSDQDIRFGAELDGGSSFVGSLDEVMVYDRALTAQEIATTGCIQGDLDDCTTDTFEPNDSPTTAAPLTASSSINAVVCDSDDDWFAVTLAAGDTIDVDLQFNHVDGDIDTQLHDPSGTAFTGSGSTSNNESMSYTALAPGTFGIRVYLYAGDENAYSMTVTVTPTPLTCGGLPVTIDMNTNGGNGTGTAAADVILGTPNADVIEGLGGDDRICGGGGDDEIFGNAGRDIINGQGGNDLIYGGGGNDSITGGDGEDTIFGQFGGDTIRGGNDDDLLLGGPGYDNVYGEAGDDNVQGAGGNDRLWGGDGDDAVYGKAGQDEMYGGAGSDELYGAGGDDRMEGGDGNDRIQGAGGDDVMLGGGGDDVLYGQNHDDIMDGEAGDDVLYGSSGNDLITGGEGDDNLQGASGDDTLLAGSGNDTLYAGPGTDELNGGPDVDTCWGGASDTLTNC